MSEQTDNQQTTTVMMNDTDVLDHVLAMVRYYRNKMEEGQLGGSEAAVYLKCLTMLGLTDAVMTTRNVERLAQVQTVNELPFPCALQ